MKTISEIIFRFKTRQFINDDVKVYINNEIENGIYHDGYDIAVKSSLLTESEAVLLLETAAKNNKVNDEMIEDLSSVYLDMLVASIDGSYVWVDDDNVVFSNGLIVARYSFNGIMWKTRRISWDGISGLAYRDDKIHGKWFEPQDLWFEFEIDYDNGSVINGPDYAF